EQTTGAPAVQVPAWQTSFAVQRLPSSHGVPSGFGATTHAPVDGSQTPAWWQASAAGQVTGAPEVHGPAMHASPCVRRLRPSHGVPSGLGATAHAPVVGSQTPAWWQASAAGQVTGAPAVQEPAMQASPCVQRSPSSHGVPSGFGATAHAPVDGSQTPAW